MWLTSTPAATALLSPPPPPGSLPPSQAASERVFVPLTVGGGIRGFTAGGKQYSALEVASEYFRWGGAGGQGGGGREGRWVAGGASRCGKDCKEVARTAEA